MKSRVALISSDIGPGHRQIIDRLEAHGQAAHTNEEVYQLLRDEIAALLAENNTGTSMTFSLPIHVLCHDGRWGQRRERPPRSGNWPINTSNRAIGSFWCYADTFRAAAVDQLSIWSRRTGAGFFCRG